MNNTWFAQLVVAFILAAVVGLYIVPRTLSAEEMSQIVGACGCIDVKTVSCVGYSEGCYTQDWVRCVRVLENGLGTCKLDPESSKRCLGTDCNNQLGDYLCVRN